MIEVSRLKDLNAAKLFLSLRIGAISRRDFAVFPVEGQSGLRRLERYFGDKLSAEGNPNRCISSILFVSCDSADAPWATRPNVYTKLPVVIAPARS